MVAGWDDVFTGAVVLVGGCAGTVCVGMVTVGDVCDCVTGVAGTVVSVVGVVIPVAPHPKSEFSSARVAAPTYPVPYFKLFGARMLLAYFCWKPVTADAV